MNKRWMVLLATFVIIISLDRPLDKFLSIHSPDAPTEGGVFDDEENRSGRESYFNLIHTGDRDDTTWHESIKKIRRSRSERVMGMRKSRSGTEVIGNGALTGIWTERGAKNQAGRILVTDVLEEKNLVVLGTNGGSLMVGDLSGNEYDILNDQINFSFISLHSFVLGNGTVRIVVVDEEGVFYTDNSGISWSKSFTGEMHSSTLSRIDNIIYILMKSGAVQKSSDFGETFTEIGNFGDLGHYVSGQGGELWTPRYEAGPLYVVVGTTLHKWDGNSFVTAGTVPVTTNYNGRIGLSGNNNSDGSLLYACYYGKVFKSTDGGVNWSEKNLAAGGSYPTSEYMMHSNGFYSADDSTLYVGQIECIRSRDGGETWEALNRWSQYNEGSKLTNIHADIFEIRSYQDSSGTDLTLISCDGGLYVTYDHNSYTNLTMSGMRNAEYYGTLTRWEDPNVIMAGAQDQGVQISNPENGGPLFDFTQWNGGDDGSFASSDSGKSAWYSYIYGTLYYWPDTKVVGYHEAQYVGKPDPNDSYLWMTPTKADPNNPLICYTGGKYLHKTTGGYAINEYGYNQFSSTSEKQSEFSFNSIITALEISPLDDNHWYIATEDAKFYHSSDRGKNWSLMNAAILQQYESGFVGQSIVADSKVLGRVYLSGAGNGQSAVLVSDNHGSSFSALGNNYPTTSVIDMAFDEDQNYLFAASVTGPFVYVAADNNWYDLAGTSAPDVRYFSVEYVPTINTVRFGTHGRGIWDFTLDDVTPRMSAIKHTDTKIVIQSVTSNTVSLTVPMAGEYSIKVVSLNGRIISNTRINGVAGINSIKMGNSNVAPGIYLLSVNGMNNSITQRISIK